MSLLFLTPHLAQLHLSSSHLESLHSSSSYLKPLHSFSSHRTPLYTSSSHISTLYFSSSHIKPLHSSSSHDFTPLPHTSSLLVLTLHIISLLFLKPHNTCLLFLTLKFTSLLFLKPLKYIFFLFKQSLRTCLADTFLPISSSWHNLVSFSWESTIFSSSFKYFFA